MLINDRPASRAAFREAAAHIAGGVNSPVRALKAVGETPLFIDHARGAHLFDIDGNTFVDFCLSWGVMIAGHAPERVVCAAADAVSRGSSYGIPTEAETLLAREICRRYPSIERVRMVNSGTEATMSAIRLARGYTGRDLIVKFEGCYHGHVDHLLVQAGSGAARISGATSAGVPRAFTEHTRCLPYNDIEALKSCFACEGDRIAAVILEPVAANMGVIPPDVQWLSLMRELTLRTGALLIWDEVITGCRLSPCGAQGLYDIRPDLTCLGKIVGGGMPMAAFGGRADIMTLLAPEGPVYQAGTLSGNPVAMATGRATLDLLTPEAYAHLEAKSDAFLAALAEVVRHKDILLNRVGSMWTLFVSPRTAAIRNFEDVRLCDMERFARLFRHLLQRGFYISPSQYETNFISLAHTDADLSAFIEAVGAFHD